jgi:hypothetical protein
LYLTVPEGGSGGDDDGNLVDRPSFDRVST